MITMMLFQFFIFFFTNALHSKVKKKKYWIHVYLIDSGLKHQVWCLAPTFTPPPKRCDSMTANILQAQTSPQRLLLKT